MNIETGLAFDWHTCTHLRSENVTFSQLGCVSLSYACALVQYKQTLDNALNLIDSVLASKIIPTNHYYCFKM